MSHHSRPLRASVVMLPLFGALSVWGVLARESSAGMVQVTNLVTDDQSAHPAQITDPNLVNAWGVSHSATSPFWVSDNGTGLSTLYTVDPVTNATTKNSLEVAIPGDGSVTGQVFNGASATGAFNGDLFMFVNEDGTISGWRGALGTNAEVLQTASDNVYKGTTLVTTGGHSYLLSANFHTGAIDVLKGDAGAPSLSGTFVDPNLPAGYAPFNIENVGNAVYVTYAVQGAGKDEQDGAGLGIVDKFDLNGVLLGRVGTGGTLNAPWGLAIAPASFTDIAGDLLVGNFGDGTINIFDLGTNMFVGQLLDTTGNVLTIDGLWALNVGNNGNAGSSEKVYFTAGPDGETHGLFGVLEATAVPEPSTLALAGTGALALLAAPRRRRQPVA